MSVRGRQALVIVLGVVLAGGMTVLGAWQLQVFTDQANASVQARAQQSPVPLLDFVAADGTATFFRYQLPADDGTLSTTGVRIQGKAGLVSDPSAELGLSNIAIVNGAPLTIDAASATVPATL